MKKVSIIVPIYNVEKYINRCYESLLKQTYNNIEIISVIDGSKDNSEKIIRHLMKKNNNIKIVVKENGGLSSARNEGQKHANGEYIMYVDSDDWLDLNTVERCVEEMELTNSDVVIFPYIKEFKNKSIKLSFFPKRTVFENKELNSKIYRRFFGLYGQEMKNPTTIDQLSTATCKLYRSDIAKKTKFVDTKIIGTEDAYYNIEVFHYVKKAVYIDDVYYHYFKENENSLTNNYNEKLFERWQTLYSYMRNHIDKNNLDDDFIIALNNRICLNQLGLSLNISNSKISLKNKLQELNKMLNQDIYSDAYKLFSYNNLDLKWKFFYNSCKKKKSLNVLILSIIAERIRRYRNK